MSTSDDSLFNGLLYFSRRVCISRRTRAKVSERALSSCIMHEANSGSGASNLPHLPPRGLASPPERGRPWISLPSSPPAFSPTKYYFTCIFIALRLNTALTFFPPPPPTTLSPPVLPFSRAGGHDDDERGGGGGGKEGGRCKYTEYSALSIQRKGITYYRPPPYVYLLLYP